MFYQFLPKYYSSIESLIYAQLGSDRTESFRLCCSCMPILNIKSAKVNVNSCSLLAALCSRNHEIGEEVPIFSLQIADYNSRQKSWVSTFQNHFKINFKFFLINQFISQIVYGMAFRILVTKWEDFSKIYGELFLHSIGSLDLSQVHVRLSYS